jgi:hypothetical protein
VQKAGCRPTQTWPAVVHIVIATREDLTMLQEVAQVLCGNRDPMK